HHLSSTHSRRARDLHSFPTRRSSDLAGLGQLPVLGREFIGDGAELGAVVDIASVNLMKQGDVEIGAHQQAEADLAQIAALLLVTDRKSTRLNSSHVSISYAVFCLKKK